MLLTRPWACFEDGGGGAWGQGCWVSGEPLHGAEPRGQGGKWALPEQNVAFFFPVCPMQGFLLAGEQRARAWGGALLFLASAPRQGA